MMSFCLWDFPGGVQSSFLWLQQHKGYNRSDLATQIFYVFSFDLFCNTFLVYFPHDYQKIELPNFPVFKQGPRRVFAKV